MAISVVLRAAGNHRFTSLLDAPDLLYTVIIYLVVMPVLWGFYLRETVDDRTVFLRLLANGVFGARDSRKHDRVVAFVTAEIERLNCKRFFMLATLLVTVTWAIVEVPTFAGPGDRFLFGYKDHWWHVVPVYFWGAWMPLVYINIYMDVSLLFRRVLTIRILNRTLRSFAIAPQLFHPDDCNGLSPIGSHAVRFAPWVALAGIWLFLFLAYPQFFHQGLQLPYDFVTLLVAYVALVPLVLLWPVWQTHRVMSGTRAGVVEESAKWIRAVMSSIDPVLIVPNGHDMAVAIGLQGPTRDSATISTALDLAVRRYELVRTAQRSWPFRRRAVGRYLGTTALPVVLAIVSIALQVLALPRFP